MNSAINVAMTRIGTSSALIRMPKPSAAQNKRGIQRALVIVRVDAEQRQHRDRRRQQRQTFGDGELRHEDRQRRHGEQSRRDQRGLGADDGAAKPKQRQHRKRHGDQRGDAINPDVAG